MNKCCKSTFNRPPVVIQAFTQRAGWDAGLFTPLSDTHCTAIKTNHMIVFAVPRLCGHCCPHTVTRFVMAITINPFNAVLGRWTRPHVGEKWFKGQPTLTNSDPTTTVEGVAVVGRIKASPKHCVPAIVCASSRPSVLKSSSTNEVALQAAATSSLATTKIATNDSGHGVAFTTAQPTCLTPLVVSSVFNDSQSPEHLPGQVFHAGRDHDRISFSHDDTSSIRLVRTARALQRPGRSSLYPDHLAA